MYMYMYMYRNLRICMVCFVFVCAAKLIEVVHPVLLARTLEGHGGSKSEAGLDQAWVGWESCISILGHVFLLFLKFFICS